MECAHRKGNSMKTQWMLVVAIILVACGLSGAVGTKIKQVSSGENQQMMVQRSFSLSGGTAYGEAMAVDSSKQTPDVNELADWAQYFWNTDADVRAAYTEAQWQEFINSIKSGQ
jgi:hypothetical protein